MTSDGKSSRCLWQGELKIEILKLLNPVKQFQRRRFLEIDQSETRIACGGHVC
jgi:hypothetical protein